MRAVVESAEEALGVPVDRLRRAFVARYGVEVGAEVTADVVAWAWEHRAEVQRMHNPAGYLFRVGQSKARRHLRWRRERPTFPREQSVDGDVSYEPGLVEALAALDHDQRVAVMLVHCFGWAYAEVAEVVDVPLHTVRNRVHRGMAALRVALGVKDE